MNYGKSNIVKKHKELTSTSKRLTTKIMVGMFKVSIFALILLAGAVGFLGLGMVKGIIDGAPDIETINITALTITNLPVIFLAIKLDCKEILSRSSFSPTVLL